MSPVWYFFKILQDLVGTSACSLGFTGFGRTIDGTEDTGEAGGTAGRVFVTSSANTHLAGGMAISFVKTP